MKLAIMQPYFMPYLGYFSLIKNVDQFILFDTPQFIRHGWIERNNILKPNGEPLYIKVPLQKHKRETKINNILINNDENWKLKIFAQLEPYKKKAPNYFNVVGLLEEIFDEYSESIVDLNYRCLKKICERINIKTPIKIWSKMNITIKEANEPDEWALNICKVLDAEYYYNPIGGKSFFDRNKYEVNGISLKFLEFLPLEYNQFENQFVPNLSIIDVMMFCDTGQINDMINSINYVN